MPDGRALPRRHLTNFELPAAEPGTPDAAVGQVLRPLAHFWTGVPVFFVISGYCIAADSARRRPHPAGRFAVALGLTRPTQTLCFTMPVCVAAALATAWAFHRWVERRFLNAPADAPLPRASGLQLPPLVRLCRLAGCVDSAGRGVSVGCARCADSSRDEIG